MRIDTQRLTLNPMTLADLKKAERSLSEVVRLYGAEMPYIGYWEMRSKRRIYKIKSDIIRLQPRAWLVSTSWLIIDRERKVMIGEAGFKGPPESRGMVEIGYGVFEQFRNKGFMTEAVGALSRLAFVQREYRIERVSALTLPENIASHRVLEKNRYVRQPSYGKYWLWERLKQPEDTAEGMVFE